MHQITKILQIFCCFILTITATYVHAGMRMRLNEQTAIKNSCRISASGTHSLFLNLDGSITAYGDNSWGIADPPAGNKFIAVSAGTYYSLALTSTGNIIGWGRDTFGQVNAPEGNKYIAISAGSEHSLALTSDGEIITWGSDKYGLGDVPKGNGYIAIFSGDNFSMALKSDGSIICWGDQESGMMNQPKGKGFIAVAAGLEDGLALRKNGQLFSWGKNGIIQGNLPLSKNFVAIDANNYNFLALKSDGSLINWGDRLSDEKPPASKDFVAIATGPFHSIALKSDGTLVSWGEKSAMIKPVLPYSNSKRSTNKVAIKEFRNASSLWEFKPFPKNVRLLLNENDIAIDLVYIKAGNFTMGDDAGKSEKYHAYIAPLFDIIMDTWPEREIKITKDFYIGKYKVTCTQFCRFLNTVQKPQEYIKLNSFSRIELKDGIYAPKENCADCPVNTVHWQGARGFCEWLSKKTGLNVRLPTEAEWEYVARGAENRHFPWGDNSNIEWVEDPQHDYKEYPHLWSCAPVGTFVENVTPDGVIGMAGRVGEWCSDLYGARYLKNDLIDPQGPSKKDLPISISHLVGTVEGEYYVFRGLGKKTTSRYFGNIVGDNSGIYGFRIVVESNGLKSKKN